MTRRTALSCLGLLSLAWLNGCMQTTSETTNPTPPANDKQKPEDKDKDKDGKDKDGKDKGINPPKHDRPDNPDR